MLIESLFFKSNLSEIIWAASEDSAQICDDDRVFVAGVERRHNLVRRLLTCVGLIEIFFLILLKKSSILLPRQK